MAVDRGWLVEHRPSLPSVPQVRMMYVCNELSEELELEIRDVSTSFRTAQLIAVMDNFVGGGQIRVGSRKTKHADMKQLEPNDGEVWELISVAPKPSIRIFGRFALPDVFVATHKEIRNQLGGFDSVEFRRQITNCERYWRKYLHSWPPLIGGALHDYITDNAIDVSNL